MTTGALWDKSDLAQSYRPSRDKSGEGPVCFSKGNFITHGYSAIIGLDRSDRLLTAGATGLLNLQVTDPKCAEPSSWRAIPKGFWRER